MTDIQKIILSLFLGLITAIILELIRLFIWYNIDCYRVISGFKKQLDNGEITMEEYNRKVKEFSEKFKSGKIDRK